MAEKPHKEGSFTVFTTQHSDCWQPESASSKSAVKTSRLDKTVRT